MNSEPTLRAPPAGGWAVLRKDIKNMKSNINIFAAPTEQAGVMFKSRLVQVKVYTDNTTIYIYVVKNWTNIYCYWD